LIYANNRVDQMAMQDEITTLESTMPDFEQTLVCMEESEGTYQGMVNQQIISTVMADSKVTDWTVYLCGPKPMISAVQASLKKLRMPSKNIHFEHLSF
jgi:ferredoxin-NADP reductase